MSFKISTLSNDLPSPIHTIEHKVDEELKSTELQPIKCVAPKYRQRENWKPKSIADFGNGGAFPEISMPQFPLGMGQINNSKTNSLPIKMDEDGKVAFHSLASLGHDKNKIVHATYKSLIPKLQDYSDPDILKPSEEDLREKMEETKNKLSNIVEKKISSALPVQHAQKMGEAQYIRYTPSSQHIQHNSGAQQRIVKLVEIVPDPMEPPKFRVANKIPQRPPSPPAPVLHSPTKKLSQKEQQNWKIPPCISNWKNNKGYTIPLDKRLAADGRGMQAVHINENFAKLAESLYIADRKAREAVTLRAQVEKRISEKAKERKEENLRELARQARESRSGKNNEQNEPVSGRNEGGVDKDVLEREKLRNDRRHERQRDRNIARAAPNKRNKLQKDRERDISEKIALGLAKPTSSDTANAVDQRLYSGSKGVGTGFGDDEAYNVYDSAWRSEKSLTSIYRPSKKLNEDIDEDNINNYKDTSKFVPAKGFSGAKRDKNAPRRDGPIQFETDDPFGLKILSEAKKSKKD